MNSRENRVREALLAFAAVDEDRQQLPPVPDWEAVLSAAQAHGLVPLANRRIRREDCPPEVARSLRQQAFAMALRLAQLEGVLCRVLSNLEAAGVDAIVLKGPALAHTAYPDPSLRPYGDLDLLCREEDWVAAHEALVGLGFTPARKPPPPPKLSERKALYHVQYWRDEGRLLVEVHFDPWENGLRPRLGDAYWQRARTAHIDDTPARVLALEDQILHSCVHLHHHGYSRLIWFVDLALLLHGCGAIDWRYLVQTARKEGIDLFVYYSLLHLSRLLGVAVPASVMVELRPAAFRRWLHDRLWPMDSVGNPEAEEPPVFQFGEIPRAIDIVLNLLLAGRRREKLAYLARLLVPPSNWLAFRYGTEDPARLRLWRFAHMPKLLLTTVRQIGGAACLTLWQRSLKAPYDVRRAR